MPCIQELVEALGGELGGSSIAWVGGILVLSNKIELSSSNGCSDQVYQNGSLRYVCSLHEEMILDDACRSSIAMPTISQFLYSYNVCI